MISRRCASGVVLLLALLVAAAPSHAAKPYRAERFDVRLSVEQGGSMVVTEQIRFTFGADQFTYVFRELPARKIDRLTVLSVEMDGRAFSPGKGPGEYEFRKTDNGGRRVTWHFAHVTAEPHDFTLIYRVEGVVQAMPEADLLQWNLLPLKHEYPIDCSTIDVNYPGAASLIAPPMVEPAQALSADRTVHAQRCDIAANQGWLLTLQFQPNSLITQPPGWQQRSTTTARNAPLFLGLAGLILFGGVLAFVMFSRNHAVPSTGRSDLIQVTPPDDLPVAIAGMLAGPRRGVSWSNAIGTVMDLAQKGVIRISATDGASWLQRRDATVTLLAMPRDVREHEQVLLDILFAPRGGRRESVRFSQLTREFTSGGGWKRYTKAVLADMRREGLIDAERERTQRAATWVGFMFILLSAVAFGATVAFANSAGGFILAIPAAIFLVGLVGVITASTLSRLSDKGLERARGWQAYRRYLSGMAKPGAVDVSGNQFEALLPLAAAFGVALGWAKTLEKQGALALPAWFQAAALDDGRANTAALVEMLTVVNAAGAHVDGGAAAGGAAGAGAAGGGASGAG